MIKIILVISIVPLIIVLGVSMANLLVNTAHFSMNKEKNLNPSQGLNLGLPNTSQMLLPLRHQDS